MLADPRTAAKPAPPIQQCRLSEIQRHVLRVECRRCSCIVEIQKLDAVRFYGRQALWKDVGQRLLDQTSSKSYRPARGRWMLAGLEPMSLD